jgi:hypothetical protein
MSYLQLPPVHGYGVPQILSQWQAGLDSRENQKRYETELAFKKKESARAEKQFDMQMETHKANIENIQSAQRIAIGDQGFKLADYAYKLAEDPSKAPMANEIRKQAYGRWEKAFGITFDVEAINKLNGLSLQAKEEESQILNGIQKGLDAGRNGDIKSLYKVNDALTAIENNKKLKPNIIVALREQVKTAMGNIPKPEGSLTDVQKQAAMDKRAGYVPQTKKEAIELRKSGATQINLGEVADKIKTQEQAKDEAKWIGTSAREEAEKIAKNTIGDDWVDLTKDEKSAQTQTVLHRKLISIYGDKVKYGQDNGVLGWYLQDETGAMKLIKRWQ